MSWKTLFGMGTKKLEQAQESLTVAVVNFDPETATEVQIDQMDKAVTVAAKEVHALREDARRERKEAEEIVELWNQRFAAAEKLQEMLADATGKKATSIEASLDKLATQLSDMEADVEREKEEAEDAEAVLADAEAALKDLADGLKTARKTLKDAQRSVKKAELDADRARKKEERAKVAAGIKQKATGLNTALDAMNKKAEQSKATAAAANMKADLLKPTSIEDDPNIAAAMAAASGDSTEKLSASDRLAKFSKMKK
jgi:chromosome segregation ATPase